MAVGNTIINAGPQGVETFKQPGNDCAGLVVINRVRDTRESDFITYPPPEMVRLLFVCESILTNCIYPSQYYCCNFRIR
jgi:hypothetical protein